MRRSMLVPSPTPTAPAKWSIRIGTLMSLPEVFAEHGLDPVALLKEVGLSPTHFADPEATIPFSVVDTLLRLGVERSGCAHLGLLVGLRAPAQSMGAVGYLMLSSSSVGHALQCLAEHLEVHDRGAVVRLRVEEGLAILSYTLVAPRLTRPDQILAASTAVGRNLMRGLCGGQWQPQAVTFSFARPASVAPYRQCFGVTPQFDAPETALVFPARQLAQSLPGTDQFLHQLMRERVSMATQAMSDDMVESVRRALRAHASTGLISVTTVAEELGMHGKTLARRLAALGTSFRTIREEVLFDNAKELLRSTRLSTGEIASAFGYADPTVFSRAFRRWSGTTPSRWRLESANRR